MRGKLAQRVGVERVELAGRIIGRPEHQHRGRPLRSWANVVPGFSTSRLTLPSLSETDAGYMERSSTARTIIDWPPE